MFLLWASSRAPSCSTASHLPGESLNNARLTPKFQVTALGQFFVHSYIFPCSFLTDLHPSSTVRFMTLLHSLCSQTSFFPKGEIPPCCLNSALHCSCSLSLCCSVRSSTEGDICPNCDLAALFVRPEFLTLWRFAGVNVFGLVFKQEQTSVALCWRGFPMSWSKIFPIIQEKCTTWGTSWAAPLWVWGSQTQLSAECKGEKERRKNSGFTVLK